MRAGLVSTLLLSWSGRVFSAPAGLDEYLNSRPVLDRRDNSVPAQDMINSSDQFPDGTYACSMIYPMTTNDEAATTMCKPHCVDIANATTYGMQSIACVGMQWPNGSALVVDQPGGPQQVGKCHCDIPLVDFFTHEVILALPEIAAIGCDILFGTFTAVLQIGLDAIPGEGELSAGIQAGISAASIISKLDDAAEVGSTFMSWFKSPCPTSKFDGEISDIFGTLIGGAGRRGLPVGKGRPPKDPAPPKPSDPVTSKPSDPVTSKPGESTTKPDESTTTTKSGESTTTTKPNESTTTTKSGESTTTKPGESTTTKPGESTTTQPRESTTTKSGEPTTTKSGESTTTKSGESTTTKSGESTTTKPGQPTTTTKSGESTTTKPGETTTTKPEESTTTKPGESTSSPSSRRSSSSSSRSSTSSSSSSSSSSACSHKSTSTKGGAAPKATKRAAEGPYQEPDDCEVQSILALARKYDNDKTAQDELINQYIIPKYMTKEQPAKSASMFYIGSSTAPNPQIYAQLLKNFCGKDTIETVFYPYSQGCFNVQLEPLKTLAANQLTYVWWRATSRAFARQTSGSAFLIYDQNDPKSAKGRDGHDSIFVSDEYPELIASGKVDVVYQVSTAMAQRWCPANPPDLLFGSYTTPPTQAQGGKMPVVQLWKKGDPARREVF